MGLDKTLKVISVGRWDDVKREWVGGDRALNTEHSEYRALRIAYERTRSDVDRDALPLKDGMRPLLWHIDVPKPDQWAIICDTPVGARRASLAVSFAATAVTDRTGKVHQADKVNGIAGDAWLKRIQTSGGGALLLELGECVYRRGLDGDRDEGDGDPLFL